MAATEEQVREWITEAPEDAEYMVVHSEGFGTNYSRSFHPSYEEAVDEHNRTQNAKKRSVSEVYDLTAEDLNWQVEKNRAFEL